MLNVAIVGGGLCGLALARHLQGWVGPMALYEARERLGGRVLSLPVREGTPRVDLGPAWYWPSSQPLMVQLVDELELQSFAQFDEGEVLAQQAAGDAPSVAQRGPVHDGARRLANGMASLTDALAQQLPTQHVHLGHALRAVVRREHHLELEFSCGDGTVVVLTRTVVLAIPPRVLHAQVRFEPALDEPVRAALGAVPTWMAVHAKAVVGYERPWWRQAGKSGSAFVRHEQAVLAETYDACETSAEPALAGFLALPPERRREYRVGLPLLIDNQLTQLFGEAAPSRGRLLHDWADEPYTCTAQDEAEPADAASHERYGNPALREPLWQQRLYLGSSETATHGGGYLEGALDAALRIAADFATGHQSRGAAPTARVFELVEQACTDVLTLTEGLEMEDLLRSRLTRPEVRRQTWKVATELAGLPTGERSALPELDWNSWQELPRLLESGGALEEDALCIAVESLMPVTLMWLRLYRNQPPQRDA
jgi:monoamine oxidase